MFLFFFLNSVCPGACRRIAPCHDCGNLLVVEFRTYEYTTIEISYMILVLEPIIAIDHTYDGES